MLNEITTKKRTPCVYCKKEHLDYACDSQMKNIMLNELENKIRKAIPELNEFGAGCKFMIYGCNFKCIEICKDEIVYIDDFGIQLCDLSYFKENINDYEISGKPIQLNHVLEYVYLKVAKSKHHLLFGKICELWNLKSNLLSDQSEELIKFINELKK